MRRKLFSYGLSTLLVLGLLWGCNTEDVNFDNMSGNVIWEPEFVLPMASGEFTLWDFLSQSDSVITRGDDGAIKIVYREDSVMSVGMSDFVEIPSQQSTDNNNFVITNLSIDDIEVVDDGITMEALIAAYPSELGSLSDGSQSVFPAFTSNNDGGDYDINNLDDFEEATFSEGTLGLTATNNFPVAADMTLELVDALNGKLFDFDFQEIAPGGQEQITYDLTGTTISSYLIIRLTSFSTTGSATPVDIDYQDNIEFTFTITDALASAGTIKVPEQVAQSDSTDYDLSVGDGVELTTLTLKEGRVNYMLESGLENDVNIRLTLPTATIDGAIATTTIPVSARGIANSSWDISGAEIDLTQGETSSTNVVPIKYEVVIPGGEEYFEFESGDYLTSEMLFNNIEIEYAAGDFGQMDVTIDPGEISLDVAFWEQLDGGFTLADPQLNFDVSNSIGVPAVLQIELTGYSKNGSQQALNGDPLNVPYPATPAEGTKSATISYDKTNSDIVDLIALPPSDKIEYSGSVTTNSAGTPVTENFIYSDSEISVDLELDLPFAIQTEGISMTDTMAISGEDFEQLVSGELIIDYNNGLPVALDLELTMVDTVTNTQYDQISVALLEAATVDEEGAPTAAASGVSRITLTQSNVENLKRSNGIWMTLTFATPEDGTKPGKMLADSELDLNISVQARADFSK